MSDDDSGGISRRLFIQASAASLVVPQLSMAAAPATTTVSQYILTRLKERGVDLLFGVPGATCDPLFAAASASPVGVVVNSSDLEAGYAADGYARMRGLSAVAVTYGVGTMSLLSVIGGAFAERSPVVVINGGPTPEDLRIQKELGSYFSHSIGREKTDLAVFKEVTEYAERAERAADVPRVVDAAIRTAVMKQRPVYIEIPKQLWEASCAAPTAPLDVTVAASGEEDRLAAEIVEKLRAAARPALLLGIEIQRYGVAKEVTALVQKLGLPWASTLLGKSVIPEQTAGFVGVYAGERSVPAVKKVVEESDALLAIGTVLGRQYRALVTRSIGTMMIAANDGVRAGKKPAVKAALGPLIASLTKQEWKADPALIAKHALPGLSFAQRRSSIAAPARALAASADPGMTYDEVMGGVSDFLDETFIAITDTSLSMYPAAELNVAGAKGFVCNAVFQAIGFSVGAAVGVGLAQERRPLVVCGDGGFQMTAQSLSTMVQRKMRSIVVVLDNGHYGIEQFLLDPAYFSDPAKAPRPYLRLNAWNYVEFAKALGFAAAASSAVETVADLKAALTKAKGATGPVFIAARIKPRDLPAGLRS